MKEKGTVHGAQMTVQTQLKKTVITTPLGDMLLAASERGLSGVWFVQGQTHLPNDDLIASWSIAQPGYPSHTILDTASQQLNQYFLGQLRQFDLLLDLSAGTNFQQSVWSEIKKIGFGQSNTYGAICQAINKPQAARAVGAATGRNPISIIVPCHRVVGASGAMTGYAGGLERKAALLKLESANS